MQLPSRLRTRPRSASLFAILLLTVALAGVLTYEAWDAARSHRATAERTLRDYASFAAWEFTISAKDHLYSTLIWIFGPVAHEDPLMPHEPLKAPKVLARLMTKDFQCPDSVRYYFRVDLPSKNLVIDGTAPSPAVQRWIADTVATDVALLYKRDWSYSSVSGAIAGEACSIVYQVKWNADRTPAAAYGFRLCLANIATPAFGKAMSKSKLLPPSLIGNTPNDSILSVVVNDGAGHMLWRSARQFPAEFQGENSMAHFGGFVTKVAINPEFASRLVIGGLPQSRLPLLLGLLALTVALATMGVLQLRREDELARLRSDFVTSVSHELRTPLAQLRMFAETLMLGRVRSEEERQRSLEIVDQEARRLSHLVENILHFSRAERQAVTLCPVDTALAPQLRDALELFAPMVRARQVRISTQLDDGISAPADASALRQMVLNLLDNAMKYGPAGQEVRVTLTRAGVAARITIDDEGPGIPADDRDRIWKPFQRLDRDANSAVAGSGIGLSVVRELAVRHGGRAWVEPITGGSRFVIELPFAAAGAT